MIESGTRLSRIDCFFMCSPAAIPPFIGTYLTLGDVGKESLNVVGQSFYESLFVSAKKFANRQKFRTIFSEEYSDDHIQAEMIKIGQECSYIVRLPRVRGKLIVDSIPAELPKYFYTKLTQREKVTYEGKMYDGSDYLGEDIVPDHVGIVFSSVADSTLVDRFKSNDVRIFFCFQKEVMGFLMKHLDGTFYLLQENIFVEYQSFYTLQTQLSALDPNYIVPLPIKDACLLEDEYRLSPMYLNSRDILEYDKDANCYRFKSFESVTPVEKQPLDLEYPALLFLGTGCALPSKMRNVSSTLVETGRVTYMLDCGEDSIYQIHRAYGSFDILEKLDFIFISHSHADHHLGLVSVLKQCQTIKHNIKLFAPQCVYNFVSGFVKGEFITFYPTNDAQSLRNKFFEDKVPFSLITNNCLNYNFGYKVSIFSVPHCEDSCGIRVETYGFVLAYSGDTKHDVFMRQMANNSCVLIHEATFDDTLSDRAFKVKHSTIKDAIDIFVRSNSEMLVLTHFSHIYMKINIPNSDVIIASDLFRFLPFCPLDKSVQKGIFKLTLPNGE